MNVDLARRRRYPNRARRSIRRTGTDFVRWVIACSTTCSTMPPTSATVRSGRRYPIEVRARFRAELPRQPSDLDEVYREFTDFIVPYATGNVHPGFMGWVHGGGTAVGMLAEMLAAGLNANLGGRDHIPIEVERQVVEWVRAMFGFPEQASGLFVTGTSMANLMAVLVARTAALGPSVRQRGIGEQGASLTAYTSTAAHGCISQGDGPRRLRQRCTCAASRSIDCIVSTWRRCAPGSPRTAAPAAGRFSWSVRPARSISAPSTICRRWRAVSRRGTLVSCRRCLWRARHSVAGDRAAACRNRKRRFDRARFPQMGAGAL